MRRSLLGHESEDCPRQKYPGKWIKPGLKDFRMKNLRAFTNWQPRIEIRAWGWRTEGANPYLIRLLNGSTYRHNPFSNWPLFCPFFFFLFFFWLRHSMWTHLMLEMVIDKVKKSCLDNSLKILEHLNWVHIGVDAGSKSTWSSLPSFLHTNTGS